MIGADVLAPVNHVVFVLGDDAVTWAELLGFATGAACVALAVRSNVANFPVGIANNLFFLALFLEAGLYANAALQVVYVLLGAAGWWAWLRLGPTPGRLEVTDASRTLLLWLFGGAVVVTAALVPVLLSAGDPAPFLDSVTTAGSLAAQWLLNLKKRQNWMVWMAVDLVYIPFYASERLYLTAAVYVLFLALCVAGLRGWSAEAEVSRA